MKMHYKARLGFISVCLMLYLAPVFVSKAEGGSCKKSLEAELRLENESTQDIKRMDFCSACKHQREALAHKEYIDSNHCLQDQGAKAEDEHRNKTAQYRMLVNYTCGNCRQFR